MCKKEYVSEQMSAEVGSLIYIADNAGKRRPHICIWVFTNSAGVKYDWLVLPITSTKTVGDKNLIKVEHPKLKLPSYAKLNNIKTITNEEIVEVSNKTFDKLFVDEIASKLQFIFNI